MLRRGRQRMLERTVSENKALTDNTIFECKAHIRLASQKAKPLEDQERNASSLMIFVTRNYIHVSKAHIFVVVTP